MAGDSLGTARTGVATAGVAELDDGIGREVILAVERSDFPVIKAITVYVAFATILTNLLADLLYKAVDPRVQLK